MKCVPLLKKKLSNMACKLQESCSFSWIIKNPTATTMPIRTPLFSAGEIANERFHLEIWFQIINKETKCKSSSLKILIRKEPQAPVDQRMRFHIYGSVLDTLSTNQKPFARFGCYPFFLDSFKHFECSDVVSPLINPDGSETLHCENLKKNILIVKCVITFFEHLPNPKQFQSEIGNLNVLRNFKESFESHYQSYEFSDVSVQVGEKTFKSHKFVLAAKSPVFRRMLLQEFQESKTGVITISDFEPEIFESFLKFLYTGEVEEKYFSKIKDLYFLADKYDVQTLKRHCAKLFTHCDINEDQMYDLLQMAHQYKDNDLEKLAKKLLLTTITN